MGYSIDYINQICTDLGVTAGHKYDIDGLNAICVALGGSGGYKYTIDALNAICTLQSVTAGHKYDINALNAISSGSYLYEDLAWAGIQSGGVLNQTPAWALLPYFALPATGLSIIAGETVTIFGDELINAAMVNDLTVEYTCSIGTQSGNNLVLTTPAAGNYSLVMLFKNDTYTIGTYTITLSVVPKSAATKKVLFIGDSITFGGSDETRAKLTAMLSGGTFTMLGTKREAPQLCEAWGGSKWADIATGTGVFPAFWKAGAMNIAAYFTDNSIDVPDIVYFNFGVNDMLYDCAPGSNGLTDAELLTIINHAKSIIDGFLAYNANLKIIIGLPTLTGNTSTFWDTLLGVGYSQDLYIEMIHKYSVSMISTFANGAYNSRVSTGCDRIFVDRANFADYVHLTTSGYSQLGAGKVSEINRVMINPSALTAVWENDYAKIDFTDNSGAVAEHEIYESRNGGAYTLVTTLAAGTVTYNNYTWQNANMNFKVRAKAGTWYSEYSNIVNLITPIVILTNQSTLTAFIFNVINITAGKTVNVDWGDASNEDLTGSNTNKTKNYGATGSYYVKLSGDLDYITSLKHYNQVKSSGRIGKWKMLAPDFWVSGCSFNDDISTITLSGTLNDFRGNASGVPRLSGNLSGILLPATCTIFYVDSQDFTGLPRGEFVGINSTGFYFSANNCLSAEIDSFLAYVDTYFSTHTPIKNATYTLNGAGMGIPSAAGLASRTSIQGKYTAAGFTATIHVSS